MMFGGDVVTRVLDVIESSRGGAVVEEGDIERG